MQLGPSLMMVVLGIITAIGLLNLVHKVYMSTMSIAMVLFATAIVANFAIAGWILIAHTIASGNKELFGAYYILAFGGCMVTLAYYFFFNDDDWRKRRKKWSEKGKEKIRALVRKVKEASTPKPMPAPARLAL